MRDSLTFLAILLICLLTAALVAPYFIDWSAHRGLLEAKLSQAAGTRITIAGPIRIRLLPQPTFRFAKVTIGDAAAGQQSLTAAELDVDIALTALMRGDLEVGEAVLRAPRLDLALSPNGTLNLRLPVLNDPKRVQFQHVVVADGTLTLARPGRPTLILAGLDFYGEAASLVGPFKATGRFGSGQDRHPFRLSTGAIEAGKVRVKLGLDATDGLPAIDIDGVAAQGGGPAPASLGPSFDGSATLKGTTPLDANPATIPWTLSGHIKADGDKATAADIEFRAGADLRAISATGTGAFSLGPDPRASLRLHGPLINIDSLAVAPEKSTVVPPQGIELLSNLNRRFSRGDAPALPFKIDLDYNFDTLTTGPLTVLGVTGHVGLDGAAATEIRLTANGPQSARVTLDGRLEGGAAPVFRGHFETQVRDLPRFADWLAPVLPDASGWIKANVPARALGFEGGIELSGVGVALRDASLKFDQSHLAGTLSYTRAVGDDRARLFADLTSDALDLDALPDLGASGTAVDALDLDITLSARAIKIVPLGIGAVDAGEIDLRLHKTADDAVLDNFSAALGSARLTATGRLDGQSAAVDAHVDAPQLDAIANLLGRLLPHASTAWLTTRAPALSPAKLDLGLRAARAADGSLLPTTLALEGVMNGSRVKASLAPDTPGDIDPATAPVTIDFAADAPQALTLLRQFGVPGLAQDLALGPGRLKGKAHGSTAEGFLASIDASFGGTVLSFQGRTKSDHGTGHVSLKGSDIAPLLRAVGLVPADRAEPAEAEADLAWHNGTLDFRHLRGTLATIGFAGDLSATVTPPAPNPSEKPALFGTLSFDRLDAPALLDLALGPAPGPGSAPGLGSAPGREAEIWSTAPFASPLLSWPRAEVAVKAKSFGLGHSIDVSDASFTFSTDRGAVTLADVTGQLRSGNLSGTLTLRRDGPLAAVNGTASWSGIAVDWPGLAGRTGGTIEFGASGGSPAALIANLAGAGSVTVTDGTIAGLDPTALHRAAKAADQSSSGIDADAIRDMIGPELGRAPLRLGDVAGQATLATGVFRAGPLRAASDDWTADVNADLDLKDVSFHGKVRLQVSQPLPDWQGDPALVTLRLDGPLASPRRDVDSAGFINALQLRAIARDQERIDTLQQDINERAFFNRRLKAIRADQAAARERAKAEADASAAIAEIQRQMRQDPELSRVPAPLPSGRPGGRVPSGPVRGRPNLKAPMGNLQPAPTVADPSSAGRY